MRHQEWRHVAHNFVTQLCLFVILVALLAGVGFGQIDQGTISGNILDPSGAVIAHAKIAPKAFLPAPCMRRFPVAPAHTAFPT